MELILLGKIAVVIFIFIAVMAFFVLLIPPIIVLGIVGLGLITAAWKDMMS